MEIAFYLRLSLADDDLGQNQKNESNSIENQRLLLEEFVKSRNDLDPAETGNRIREYVDDGYTGTNFDRPAFQRMIEDAKRGEIQIIIVKDLSRLGRDYIDVGDYIEQIFPLLGIRLIAVNSNYDSDQYVGNTMGLELGINNLINSLYSKDLSKKQKASLRTKWKQGISTVGRTPMGYKKNKENPSEWDIDPEAAKIVRLIFDKALACWDTGMIADYLNDLKLPTPGAYKEQTDPTYKQWNRLVKDEEWLWNRGMVLRILKKICYTGVVEQGSRTLIKVGSHCARKSDSDKIVIIPNHHTPIVTEEEWQRAQLVIHSAPRKAVTRSTGFSLTGKLRCGNCGLAITYQGRGFPTVSCAHGSATGKHSKCDRTRYDAKIIEGIVFDALKKQIDIFSSLYRQIRKKVSVDDKSLEQEVDKIERTLEYMNAARVRLYESYVEGHVGKEEYMAKRDQIAEEIEEKQKTLDTLKHFLDGDRILLTEFSQKAQGMNRVQSASHLTRKMVEVFIEEVVIYDKWHIEIYFTFADILKEAADRLEEEATA